MALSTTSAARLLRGVLFGSASLLAVSSAQAQISFSDDFESQTVGNGVTGWTTFINAFSADCGTYFGGYLYDQTVTNQTAVAIDNGGDTVLNFFADYANPDLANPICMETNVFQSVGLVSGMDGVYQFTFDHEPGAAPGAQTVAFITVFDPGFAVLRTETAPTTGAAASGSMTFTIDASELDVGNTLQFGFRTTQVGYADSGRLYDDVQFALAPPPPPPAPATPVPALPLWALAVLAGAAGLFGARSLRRR